MRRYPCPPRNPSLPPPSPPSPFRLHPQEAVYGNPIAAIGNPRAAMLGLTSERIVRLRTGVAVEDVRLIQMRNETFRPAHYLAVDHRIRSIVVCIRGTSNVADSLTDIAATQDPMSVRAARVRAERGGAGAWGSPRDAEGGPGKKAFGVEGAPAGLGPVANGPTVGVGATLRAAVGANANDSETLVGGPDGAPWLLPPPMPSASGPTTSSW